MEIFGYWISFFSFIITILTGFLAYQAWQNGKWMKQAHNDTQNLIKATHTETHALLQKIDRTIEKLGELIVADGERTRELVAQMRAGK